LEKWRLDTVLYLRDHSPSIDSLSQEREIIPSLCDDFDISNDASDIFRNVVEKAIEFGHVIRIQKSIYYFVDLAGDFNQETMEFQESQQQEWMDDHPDITQEATLSVYPVLLKFIASQPFKACVSKGKALFRPVRHQKSDRDSGEDAHQDNMGWYATSPVLNATR
jgi:hypothetical protein